jgi:hypothetical protein
MVQLTGRLTGCELSRPQYLHSDPALCHLGRCLGGSHEQFGGASGSRRDSITPRRVTRLLKRQHGHCMHCGLRFTYDGNYQNNAFDNLRFLHGHCHDLACPERSVGFTASSVYDQDPYSEEPDKVPWISRSNGLRKVTRPVL